MGKPADEQREKGDGMEGKMMDAISRNAVLKEIDWAIDLAMDDEMHHAMCTLGERFKELPALDVAPVVHARWRDHNCTNCFAMCVTARSPQGWLINIETPYCPHCGARMGGEENAAD